MTIDYRNTVFHVNIRQQDIQDGQDVGAGMSRIERGLFTPVHGKLGACYNFRFQIADFRLKGGERESNFRFQIANCRLKGGGGANKSFLEDFTAFTFKMAS